MFLPGGKQIVRIVSQRAVKVPVFVIHGLRVIDAIGARVTAEGDDSPQPGTFRNVAKLAVQNTFKDFIGKPTVADQVAYSGQRRHPNRAARGQCAHNGLIHVGAVLHTVHAGFERSENRVRAVDGRRDRP